MRTSLQTRLIATYALLAVFSILGVSLSANLFLESQFSRYVQDRIQKEQMQTLQTLSDAYSTLGSWDQDELSVIGMNALGRGFIVRLQDNFNQVVWDARTHNNGMCQQMLATMARNMDSRYPSWTGSYQEQSFPVLVNDAVVGSAWIGYYGPFYYNDSELYFLASLNQIVIVTALISLVLATLFGVFMARWISRPLSRVTATAHQLRLGVLNARIETHSSISEINDLSASIDNLAQSLSEQEYLRRRLTSDVSHELRTPLATLQGHLEAMIDGIWPSDSQRLETCREEVLRMARLVGQIEGLAKLEAEETPLELQTVSIPRLLDQVCRNFQADYAAKQVTLTWQAEAILSQVDPDKLTQILVNLLSNALKYSDPGGQVNVVAKLESAQGHSANPEYMCISVSDSGIGIPEVDLPHIFERFYRVDSSRTRESGGAGIGLTIAQSLAQLQGGGITVESTLGIGSTFQLTLPYCIDHAAAKN